MNAAMTEVGGGKPVPSSRSVTGDLGADSHLAPFWERFR
jgi:hypothetical protein